MDRESERETERRGKRNRNEVTNPAQERSRRENDTRAKDAESR